MVHCPIRRFDLNRAWNVVYTKQNALFCTTEGSPMGMKCFGTVYQLLYMLVDSHPMLIFTGMYTFNSKHDMCCRVLTTV